MYCSDIDDCNKPYTTSYKSQWDKHCNTYKCRGVPFMTKYTYTLQLYKYLQDNIDLYEKELSILEQKFEDDINEPGDDLEIDYIMEEIRITKIKQRRHTIKLWNSKALYLHWLLCRNTQFHLNNWKLNTGNNLVVEFV